MESRGRAAILGLCAAACFGLWQFLTVHYNYGGNATALFRIRPGMPVPPFLRSEHLYTFPGTQGYDGQVYHVIAHDPWMLRGSADAIVYPTFRYQRILVPALAWILALGQDRWIHAAYFAVVLGFAFLGVYWLALVAWRAGLHPAWGLAFALVPATITSIDRMTVDIALAAFTAGFVLYSETGPRWRTIVILACAVLTRETGLLLVAGYALYLFTRRRVPDGLWALAAAIPGLVWFLYLSRPGETSPVPSYAGWIPLAGFVDRVVHRTAYALPPFKETAAILGDYAALAGVAIALVLATRLALLRRWNPQASVVYVLAIAALMIRSRDVWEDANAFGRVLTPLVLLTALQFFRPNPWLALVPMLLVDSRISLDLWSQIAGVARGLVQR
jgi:hypothetical protein